MVCLVLVFCGTGWSVGGVWLFWFEVFFFGWPTLLCGGFMRGVGVICEFRLVVKRLVTDFFRRQVRMKWRKMNSRWGVWWVH